MKRYAVRLSPEAEADIVDIYRSISEASMSSVVARQYVERLTSYLETFEVFPERGSLRNDVRQGLRVVGFERSVSVAFVVEQDSVVILRLAQNGRQIDLAD